MGNTDQINTLLRMIAEESKIENAARSARAYAETQIAELLKDELPPNGGTKTFDGYAMKFEVAIGWNFKGDVEAIKALPFADKVLETKTTFNETKYKKLFGLNADEANQIGAHVVCSPKKPAVKIKEDK